MQCGRNMAWKNWKRDAEAVSGLPDLRGGIDGTAAAGRCAGGSGNPVAGSDTGNGSICCGQEKYSDLADRTGDPFCTADSFRGGFRQTSDCGFKLLLYLSAHGSDPAAMFSGILGTARETVENIVLFVRLMVPTYLLAVGVASGPATVGAGYQLMLLLIYGTEKYCWVWYYH